MSETTSPVTTIDVETVKKHFVDAYILRSLTLMDALVHPNTREEAQRLRGRRDQIASSYSALLGVEFFVAKTELDGAARPAMMQKVIENSPEKV